MTLPKQVNDMVAFWAELKALCERYDVDFGAESTSGFIADVWFCNGLGGIEAVEIQTNGAQDPQAALKYRNSNNETCTIWINQ